MLRHSNVLFLQRLGVQMFGSTICGMPLYGVLWLSEASQSRRITCCLSRARTSPPMYFALLYLHTNPIMPLFLLRASSWLHIRIPDVDSESCHLGGGFTRPNHTQTHHHTPVKQELEDTPSHTHPLILAHLLLARESSLEPSGFWLSRSKMSIHVAYGMLSSTEAWCPLEGPITYTEHDHEWSCMWRYWGASRPVEWGFVHRHETAFCSKPWSKNTFVMEVHFCYGSSLLLWKFTFVMEVHFCCGSSLLLWKFTFVMKVHICCESILLWQSINDVPLLMQSSFKPLLLCFTQFIIKKTAKP